MTLNHFILAATLALGVHTAPVIAQDAARDTMQDYMMVSDYEAGIILRQSQAGNRTQPASAPSCVLNEPLPLDPPPNRTRAAPGHLRFALWFFVKTIILS
jgi:hypothetical protein